jgi:hypothetical protein
MRVPTPAARAAAFEQLMAGDPPIAVVLNDPTSIAFSPHLLLPGQAEIVESAVPAVLAKSLQV